MKDYAQIYKNLHKSKNGCPVYSVRVNGKVVDHDFYVRLYNCTFHVGTKGKERVRKEKRKNVHAYVQGKQVAIYDPRENRLPKDGQKMSDFQIKGGFLFDGAEQIDSSHTWSGLSLKLKRRGYKWEDVAYDPYKNDTFIIKRNNQPVKNAVMVEFKREQFRALIK